MTYIGADECPARVYEERITAVIDALSRNPRIAHTDWDRVIRDWFDDWPAHKHAALLDYCEKWCRRQAVLFLEESAPPTATIQ